MYRGLVTEEELLWQIAASPFDLELRLVYADLLAERGDPRAEVIALSMRDALTMAERRRLRALERDHARSWLGPLQPVAALTSTVFKGGFLDALTLVHDVTAEALRGVCAEPRLATVRSLDVSALRSAEGLRPFLTQKSLAAVKRLVLSPAAAPVLASPVPFALDVLGIAHPDTFDDALWPFSKLARARAVSTWELVSHLFGTHQARELFTAIIRQAGALEGVEALRIVAPYAVFEAVAAWLVLPAEHRELIPPRLTQWAIRPPGLVFTLHRDGPRSFGTLEILCLGDTMKELEDRFTRLGAMFVLLGPAALRRIELAVPSGLTPTRAHRHTLRVAARRLQGADVFIDGQPLTP